MRAPTVAIFTLAAIAALEVTAQAQEKVIPSTTHPTLEFQEKEINFAPATATVGQIPSIEAVAPPESSQPIFAPTPQSAPVEPTVSPTVSPTASPPISPTTSPTVVLKDVQGHRAEQAIQALWALGMIEGFEDGTFQPNAPIQPQHLQALVERAVKQQGATFLAGYAKQLFTSEFDQQDRQAIATLFNTQAAKPQTQPITRADAAQVIYDALLKADPPVLAQANATSNEKAKAKPDDSLCQKPTSDHQAVLDACNQALQSQTLDSPTAKAALWAKRGDALFSQGQYLEAIASYDRALLLQPKNSLVLANRCGALSELGQQTEAIAACDRALAVDQNWGDDNPAFAWYNRGLALTRLEQFNEAIAAYQKAVTIEPTYSLAWVAQAGVLSATGQQEAAIEACDRALQVNSQWGSSTPAIAWYNRGLALSRAEQYEAAVDAYQQALKLQPQDATSWTNQGVLLMKLGRNAEALKAHDAALKISPNDALALSNRAATLNQLGQYQAALSAVEQALSSNNRWGEAGPAHAWNQRSDALAALGQLDPALVASQQAIALNPNYADAWNTQATILMQLNRNAEALQASEQATTLDPNSDANWTAKGMVLQRLGQPQQAIAAFDKALALNPKQPLAQQQRQLALKSQSKTTQSATPSAQARN